MKILFYGLYCSDDLFSKFINLNPNPYSVAHRLYEKSFLEELEKEFCLEHLYIWQGISEVNYINNQISFDNRDNYRVLPFVNLPLIKFITLFLSTLFHTLKWILTSGKGKKFIISSINYGPVAFANYICSKITRVPNVIILTDTSVSNAYSKDRNDTIKSKLKRSVLRPYTKFIHFLETNYDAYVFLTEYMNEKLNTKNRPWCLIEGIYNGPTNDDSPISRQKAIMYAGTVNKNLGIDLLLDSFMEYDDSNVELWIFGKGDFENEIQKFSSVDQRIKYFGFVSRDEILKYEKMCSLLINTRNPNDEYTKLSFPSKTMEYLASGTPFMTTKLECYPEEYNDYLIFINEYTKESIVESISSYFKYTAVDIDNLGNRNKNFILTKNAECQIKKFIELLKQYERGKQ